VLRLAPFKSKVRHTQGVDNVVADALSRMFVGHNDGSPEIACASLVEGLLLVYSSLEEHQGEDHLGECIVDRAWFSLLSFIHWGTRQCRWVVPSVLRAVLLNGVMGATC
jgi:hypothetical protein